MSKQAKYIILDSDIQEPVVFSPLLQHDSVAAGRPVISAGFCRLVGTTWRAWGHSTSLGKQARFEDEAILNELLEMDV